MMSSFLSQYLKSLGGAEPNTAAAAYYASLDHIASVNPKVVSTILAELRAQRGNLKLIASENYSSLATQLAMGNLFTDKYAEGYPEHRFYAGCENVDSVELEAASQAKQLFGCDHAFVQPHSGADANMIAFMAILGWKVQDKFLAENELKSVNDCSEAQWKKLRELMHGERMLGLDYYCGGHLTHGYRFNISAQMFESYHYAVHPETKLLDYEQIRKQAHEIKPLILLAGYSAYPRAINFRIMREIADEVGAVLMVDMAHFSGLVAGKVFKDDENPIPHAHIVTSTTHKTLRGPRGGIVLCQEELREYVDKACPAVMGGPLPHVIAAKAVAFKEANTPEFQAYAQKVVDNARALAEGFQKEGMQVLTGGTDNHIVLVDVAETFGITGRQAEDALRIAGFTLNRNALPFDPNGPWYTSGLRLGTPATTSLGMGEKEMHDIARIATEVCRNTKPGTLKSGKPSRAKFELEESVRASAIAQVQDLLKKFPLYPELSEEILTEPELVDA
ncbi:MAG: glycine hydroxymethyltransferase [Opitutales bacterium]